MPKDCVPLDLKLGLLSEEGDPTSCDYPYDFDTDNVPEYQFGSHPDAPIHMAILGHCTFVEKARVAQSQPTNGLLVLQTHDGPATKMPSGGVDSDDIKIPVAMIGRTDGDALATLQKVSKVEGFFEMSNGCPDQVQELAAELGTRAPFLGFFTPPGALLEEDDEIGYARLLVWDAIDKVDVGTYTVAKAEFGPDLLMMPRLLYLPEPPTACQTSQLGEETANALVLATRGVCSFGLKAKSIQNRRAAGFITINNKDDGEAFPMQVAEEEENLIKLEGAMMDAKSGELLMDTYNDAPKKDRHRRFYARFLPPLGG